MNVYVWPREKSLTTSYHEGGGVVVVAPTLERAIELARDAGDGGYGPRVSEGWIPGDPFVIRCHGGEPERAWLMPDAGCC